MVVSDGPQDAIIKDSIIRQQTSIHTIFLIPILLLTLMTKLFQAYWSIVYSIVICFSFTSFAGPAAKPDYLQGPSHGRGIAVV